MGLDIGSRSAQCVILEDGQLLTYGNIETGPEIAELPKEREGRYLILPDRRVGLYRPLTDSFPLRVTRVKHDKQQKTSGGTEHG